MRTFKMIRNNDESGISGTGTVLEGALFSNGTMVGYWLGRDFNSLVIHDHFYAFHYIHIRSHPSNDTEIIFDNDTAPVKREGKQLCRHCKKPFSDHPLDKQRDKDGYRRSCSGNLVQITNV